MAVQTGYASYANTARPSPLARAAYGQPTTAANPYGLQAAKNTTGVTPSYTPPVSGFAPVKTAATTPIVPKTAGSPPAVGVNPAAAQVAPTLPPTPGGYDINTDPTLQGITALTGMGDQQANASALAQKQQLLEAYGDPGLARAVLGDANVASVAQQNPTSTVAQINQQYKQNLQNLDEQLNQQNLLYSGYRIKQQQQGATDYQNQLANAAGQVNSGLGSIDSNLAAALGQNQQQRITAQTEAANRLAQAAASAAAVPPTSAATGGDAAASGANAPPASASSIFQAYPQYTFTPNVIETQAPRSTVAGQLSGGSDTSAPVFDFSPSSPLAAAAFGSAAQRKRQAA